MLVAFGIVFVSEMNYQLHPGALPNIPQIKKNKTNTGIHTLIHADFRLDYSTSRSVFYQR